MDYSLLLIIEETKHSDATRASALDTKLQLQKEFVDKLLYGGAKSESESPSPKLRDNMMSTNGSYSYYFCIIDYL